MEWKFIFTKKISELKTFPLVLLHVADGNNTSKITQKKVPFLKIIIEGNKNENGMSKAKKRANIRQKLLYKNNKTSLE
jgi:hypothetical protein